MKKIIINEQQFALLNRLLLEEKLSQVAPKLETGDILQLYLDNTPHNFVIVNATGGQIMADYDGGAAAHKPYRIFFTPSDLIGNRLEVKRAHKTKDKEILGDVRQWGKYTFNNVKGLKFWDKAKNEKGEVIADQPKGNDDKAGKQDDKSDKQDNKPKDKDDLKSSDFIKKFKNAKKNDEITLTLDDGSELLFKVYSDPQNNNIPVTLENVVGDLGKEYAQLKKHDLNINTDLDNVSSKGETHELVIDRMLGGEGEDGDAGRDKIVIKDIRDAFLEQKADDEELPEDTPGLLSHKELLAKIMSDNNLKSAFMKAPSFLDLILKRDPEGLIKGNEIVKSFYGSNNKDDDDSKDFLHKFKIGEELNFELEHNSFYERIGDKLYNLLVGVKYGAKVYKKKNGTVILSHSYGKKKDKIYIKLIDLFNEEKNIYSGKIIIHHENKDDFISDYYKIRIREEF